MKDARKLTCPTHVLQTKCAIFISDGSMFCLHFSRVKSCWQPPKYYLQIPFPFAQFNPSQSPNWHAFLKSLQARDLFFNW